jgi:anti-sigma B factor antagonist
MADKDFIYIFPAAPGLQDVHALIQAGEKHLAGGSGAFCVDFTENTLLSSLALGAILKLHNLYRRKNRSVILLNVNADAQETLRTSGLNNILNIQRREDRRIDLSGAGVNIAVELDFEIYRDVGIFKFSGSMLTPSDSELFFNMAKKILVDGHKMLIDMGDLVYIDSMGIGSIIKIHQIMKEHEGEIRICSAGDILKDLLEKQNLLSIIPIFETRDAALHDWK